MLKGKFICAVLIFDLSLSSATVFDDNGGGVSERDVVRDLANLGQDYCPFVNEQKNQCRLKMFRSILVFDDEDDDSICRSLQTYFQCLFDHFSICGDLAARTYIQKRTWLTLQEKNRRLPACQKLINFRARGGPEPTPRT